MSSLTLLKQGAGVEVMQTGLKLALEWDAGVISNCLFPALYFYSLITMVKALESKAFSNLLDRGSGMGLVALEKVVESCLTLSNTCMRHIRTDHL